MRVSSQLLLPLATVFSLSTVLNVQARPLASSRFPVYRCMNYTEQFNDASVLVNATTWDGDARNGPKWISEYDPSHVTVENGTAKMYLIPDMRPNDFGNAYGWPAAITSSMWIGQGKVCASFRTGRGGGIVTAFMLSTYVADYEVDDELDWEIVGKPEWLQDAQSNYFALGKLNYNNSLHHSSEMNLAWNYNTYCFERTKDKITWILNNQTVRTLVREQHNSSTFPYRNEHKLAKIALSFWDGGSGSQGTSEWSGGPTDWSNPYNPDYQMFVDWVSVECYDNEGVNPATVTSFLPPLSTAKSKSATRTTTQTVDAVTTSSSSPTSITETELASPSATTMMKTTSTKGDNTSAGKRTDWNLALMIAAETVGIALILRGLLF